MKYFILMFVVWQFAQSAKLPEEVWKSFCKRNDPDYSKCVINLLEKTRPYWADGIPELGLPALDPFEMKELVVNRTVDDLANVYAVFKNIKVTGGSKVVVEDFKADPNTQHGEVRATVPRADVTLDYDIDGVIAGIPVKNKGVFQGTFSNIQAYIKMSLKLFEKNGKQYYKVDKLVSKINPGTAKIKMTSEDPAFQSTLDFATNFFNENSRSVMDMLNPVFVDTANDLFRNIWDSTLQALPADQWTP